jgi:hypothetical protein
MRRFDKHIPILSGLGDWARLRLILAHLSAHRDSVAVPGVDGGQGTCSTLGIEKEASTGEVLDR